MYLCPVKKGMMRHIMNWIMMDQVARYMPSCTQPCGAPLLSVICRARMRVAMKSTASIGANCTVDLHGNRMRSPDCGHTTFQRRSSCMCVFTACISWRAPKRYQWFL